MGLEASWGTSKQKVCRVWSLGLVWVCLMVFVSVVRMARDRALHHVHVASSRAHSRCTAMFSRCLPCLVTRSADRATEMANAQILPSVSDFPSCHAAGAKLSFQLPTTTRARDGQSTKQLVRPNASHPKLTVTCRTGQAVPHAPPGGGSFCVRSRLPAPPALRRWRLPRQDRMPKARSPPTGRPRLPSQMQAGPLAA